jgi:hypothetical protein
LVFLFFLGLACAENWLRDRQEAPNKRTETVRRRVTDLTASTPFAKPPVCKKRKSKRPTGTSNHVKLNFFFSLSIERVWVPTGFSRKELQLMYRSFKQVNHEARQPLFFFFFLLYFHGRPQFPWRRFCMASLI